MEGLRVAALLGPSEQRARNTAALISLSDIRDMPKPNLFMYL